MTAATNQINVDVDDPLKMNGLLYKRVIGTD